MRGWGRWWGSVLMEVYVAKLVVTRLTCRGKGVAEDPHRLITEVWTTEGVKIAESDPWREGKTFTEPFDITDSQ